MPSNHVLWRKPEKFQKASPIQKTMSSMQRRINQLSKEKGVLLRALNKRKTIQMRDFETISKLRAELKEMKK